MDEETELAGMEVQCYSKDSSGYYCELCEFNFTAPLDYTLSLEKCIAKNADPGLGFGNPPFHFRCYAANFLGEHINLQQKPLQVKYIVQSIHEQKNAVLYLCREDLNSSRVFKRNRSVALLQRPSRIAEDFLHKACGSLSGYESGYVSDCSSVNGVGSTAVPNFTRQSNIDEKEEDKVFASMSAPPQQWQPAIPRQMTVVPSPTPIRYQKRSNNHQKLAKSMSDVTELSSTESPPRLSNDRKQSSLDTEPPPQGRNRFSLSWSQPSIARSPSPIRMSFRSKSPMAKQTEPVIHNRKVKTLGARKIPAMLHHNRMSAASLDIAPPLPNSPKISSPIYRSKDPPPTQPPFRFQRTRPPAFKRKSLLDLGIDQPFDLSEQLTEVNFHFSDLECTPSKTLAGGTTLTLQVTVSNYTTVGDLKERVLKEIQKVLDLGVQQPSPSSLVLYYTHDGTDYELLFEHQFMFHTLYHKLSTYAKTKDTSDAVLQARLACRLPEKELRVLYRISQLTGVLLEDSVRSQGVDVQGLTSLPACDFQEVQAARRTLHSYMQSVVRERREQEYSSCRDIAYREATMQLSLMTPADNMIMITFHYKTEFSLKKRLSIHTYADKALSDLFPCLVACGLVRDSIEDYTMQVSGNESYVYGEFELIAFRHIRKCIVKAEPINLSVTERPAVEVERPHQFSWMTVDPNSTVTMNHAELSNCRPINQEDVCSVWEARQTLKLIRLKIEGIPHPTSGVDSVHVVMRLLHGSSDLCYHITSTAKLAGCDLVWVETLEFNMEIGNIPKASRIMFTLVESRSRKSSQGDSKFRLLYWGMLSVFDSSGRLRSGDHELRLWQGVEMKQTSDSVVPANTATHPANNPHHEAVRLTVRFSKTTSLPMFYPSTERSSCAVFTKQHPAIANMHTRRQFRMMLEMIKRRRLYKELPHYIQNSNWNQLSGMLEVFHALDELEEGIEDIPDHVVIRLLDSDFPDDHVRAFAVKALAQLPDENLEDFLLQLVQALKFEANHDSPLARFLLRRALTNKTIGHFFFWYLRSEMHNSLHMARFSVILEAYLKGCGEALLTKFTDQVDIQLTLCDMAAKLRSECENGRDLEKMQTLLPTYLQELGSPRFVFIPVHNPRYSLGNLKPQKCKVMSSAKRPMWLEMYNIHPTALTQSPVRLILKLGDDLRQDMITLRMFSLFEKLWEEQGLDLELIPYGCMATGPQTGFIEVVKNARTIKEVSSVTNNTRLFEWIKAHQKNEFGETDQDKLDAAIKRFTRSCAGYSVATYVLGIGDRHNDNIMVTTSGNLFHIDFGHFLGHIKYFMGFKREWAPFVLTPDFVYVMGGENSEMFETYKNLCCRAFLTLRRNADLIINLFSLMRSTGIPELTCVEDTDYIRNVLEMKASEHVAEMRFRKVIQKCLNLKWTVQIMWRLHIAKHGSG